MPLRSWSLRRLLLHLLLLLLFASSASLRPLLSSFTPDALFLSCVVSSTVAVPVDAPLPHSPSPSSSSSSSSSPSPSPSPPSPVCGGWLMMGSKSALSSSARWRTTVWLGFLLLVWFSSSILSTLVNAVLMKHFPYPVTISAVHMLSSVVVDWFIIVSRGLSLLPFRTDVFWQCLPVATTINFGKTLTYVSYGMVPASLTHTAKVGPSSSLACSTSSAAERALTSPLIHRVCGHQASSPRVQRVADEADVQQVAAGRHVGSIPHTARQRVKRSLLLCAPLASFRVRVLIGCCDCCAAAVRCAAVWRCSL